MDDNAQGPEISEDERERIAEFFRGFAVQAARAAEESEKLAKMNEDSESNVYPDYTKHAGDRPSARRYGPLNLNRRRY